ncbi:hypothetical protein PGB90_009800 [Kerria lacca]
MKLNTNTYERGNINKLFSNTDEMKLIGKLFHGVQLPKINLTKKMSIFFHMSPTSLISKNQIKLYLILIFC